MLALPLLAGLVQIAAAPPDWAVTGKWKGCPPGSCWTGVGSSTESADKARQAAIADIAHQVRVRVRSNTRDFHSEDNGRTDESSSSRSALKADEQLDGAQVVESARDGDTWYALATLERATLAAPHRAEMDKASSEASDRLARARVALSSGRLQEAGDELRAIERARRRFEDARTDASLAQPEAAREEFPLSAPVRDSLQRAMRDGLRISAPDTLILRAGKPQELVVDVTWKGAPAEGLDVEAAGRDGRAIAQATTDEKGRARIALPAGFAKPVAVRFSSSSLPPVERAVVIRREGADASYRLALDPSASPWAQPIADALARSGWNLSDKGRPLAVSAKILDLGQISGFSGSLAQRKVQLLLRTPDGESTCSSVFADSDPDAAIRTALRKLDCPLP